jgi:hypothetical protein
MRWRYCAGVGDDAGAAALLPVERPCPLPPDVAG